MEFVITGAIAVATALLGAFVGFYLGFLRTRRLQTAEFILRVVSPEFSEARIEMREILSKYSANLELVADPGNSDFAELRQKVVYAFNTYDMICDLHEKGDIDKDIFNRHLRPMIQADYDLVDPLFAAMATFQTDEHRDLKRPFFPCIARVTPRTPQ